LKQCIVPPITGGCAGAEAKGTRNEKESSGHQCPADQITGKIDRNGRAKVAELRAQFRAIQKLATDTDGEPLELLQSIAALFYPSVNLPGGIKNDARHLHHRNSMPAPVVQRIADTT